MFRSLDSEVVLDLDSDLGGADGEASDGCRLDPVTGSSRGGADMEEGLEWWASTDLVASTALVESHRFMAAHNSRTWHISMMRTSEARYRPWAQENSEQDVRRHWQRLTNN
jgi:hypothetical protein